MLAGTGRGAEKTQMNLGLRGLQAPISALLEDV